MFRAEGESNSRNKFTSPWPNSLAQRAQPCNTFIQKCQFNWDQSHRCWWPFKKKEPFPEDRKCITNRNDTHLTHERKWKNKELSFKGPNILMEQTGTLNQKEFGCQERAKFHVFHNVCTITFHDSKTGPVVELKLKLNLDWPGTWAQWNMYLP